MLSQAVHGFMSNLWLRTAGAVLICSIPVIIFVYARYWQPKPKTTEVSQTASPVSVTPSPVRAAPSEQDIQAAQKELAEIRELRDVVAKLPSPVQKPNLDSKDIQQFLEAPIFKERKFGPADNVIFDLAKEPEPISAAAQIAERLSELRGSKKGSALWDLQIDPALRDEQGPLADLDAALKQRISNATKALESTTPLPEQEAPDNYLAAKKDADVRGAIARLATLFSVIIMGIAGSFCLELFPSLRTAERKYTAECLVG